MFLHSPVASLGATMLVPIGIMSALVARDRTGRGQHVEVSLLQGVLSLTTQNWNWTDQRSVPAGEDAPAGHPPVVDLRVRRRRVDPRRGRPAARQPTRSEASVLGLEEVSFADAVRDEPGRSATTTRERRREAFKRRNRAELIDELHEAGWNAEAIVAPHERFDHPQLRATGSVVEVVDPEVGPTTQVGVTIFLERTPGEVRGPQPMAGAHTDEVLGALGLRRRRARRAAAARG